MHTVRQVFKHNYAKEAHAHTHARTHTHTHTVQIDRSEGQCGLTEIFWTIEPHWNEMNWCQPQMVSSVADIRVWDVRLFKQAPGLKYNVRTAVHLLISPTGLVEWLLNGYIPLLTPCNVCGVVGVDKHKSSEDLISMYCVYSEAMMVGARESYYFIKGGWGGVIMMYIGEGRHD